MKGSNFEDIFKSLANIEKNELKAAVLAHGGRFHFQSPDRVGVTFNSDECDIEGDCMMKVCEVAVDETGDVTVSGIPYDELNPDWGDGEEIRIPAEDVKFGNLHHITEQIPKTDKVADVTIPAFLLVLDGESFLQDILSKVRKAAADRIKSIMKEAGLKKVYTADIDEGNPPIVRPDEFDDSNTQTLDSIRLTDEGLVFSASTCYDECEYYEENIPMDAFAKIVEWFNDHREDLFKLAGTER